MQLGRSRRKKVQWLPDDQAVLARASKFMTSAGFGELKPKGQFLVSARGDCTSEAPHVGQIRISFEYHMCGPCTIVAQ